MCDVFVPVYDSDSMYRCFCHMSNCELLEEYEVTIQCLQIFLSGSDELVHSQTREFMDYVLEIMRIVICERALKAWKCTC